MSETRFSNWLDRSRASFILPPVTHVRKILGKRPHITVSFVGKELVLTAYTKRDSLCLRLAQLRNLEVRLVGFVIANLCSTSNIKTMRVRLAWKTNSSTKTNKYLKKRMSSSSKLKMILKACTSNIMKCFRKIELMNSKWRF